MTIDEMRAKKTELGLSYTRLSSLSGVPESTIQKIFSGTTSSPRYDTLRALEAAFQKLHVNQAIPSGSSYKTAAKISADSLLRESPVSYADSAPVPNQGHYTIYDREALPEDLRTELIDGVLYAFASPTSFHQLIAGEVYRQIANYIYSKNGSCMPMIAPIDVQLDQDEKTMLQPDVIIVCNREILTVKNVYGAPDFVLEIISPSTRRRDYTKKLAKYEHAGVREYWIVDPYQRRIMVYFFEDDTRCPAIYPFDAEIPVSLYDGDLKICLSKMIQWLPEA
ncbi:MAG: Uma2 family endonuclease [Lachnospiraceae bacterium]|nr:Uma2 family endonuclease [Lachnospiraceae bacterium]